MKKQIIKKIFDDTQSGYDSIALKFSQTRKHSWHDLKFAEAYVRPDTSVLDYGCGNGRLIELFPDAQIAYAGVDVSALLLEQAQKKYYRSDREFIHIDPSFDSLPFPGDYFNTIFSVAVFHHIPGKVSRKKVALELYRVARPGGHIVVTVWDLWQERYRHNIIENWKKKIMGKSELDWNDCRVSFKDNDGRVFMRYHHAFRVRELRRLFEGAGFQTKKCQLSGRGNIVYVGGRV